MARNARVTQAYDFTLLSPRTSTPFGVRAVVRIRARGRAEAAAGDAAQGLLAARRRYQPRTVALGRQLRTRFAGDPAAIVREMLHPFREEPFDYTLRTTAPCRQRGRRIPVCDPQGFLRALRLGVHGRDASRRHPCPGRDGIPGRRIQPVRRVPYRATIRRARMVGGVDRRPRLARVDPTAAVAPERIHGGLISAVGADEPVPGRLRDASALWMTVELGWDAVNDFWNERVIRFDAHSQFEMLERLGVDEPDWRALGLGLAGSLALFFVALTAYLAWRFRPPRRDWPARLHALVGRRLREAGPATRTAPKVRSPSCNVRKGRVPTSPRTSPTSAASTWRSDMARARATTTCSDSSTGSTRCGSEMRDPSGMLVRPEQGDIPWPRRPTRNSKRLPRTCRR